MNSLITAGQYWRLVTPAFLHANLIHLAVNCYSLNNLGPSVEMQSGGKRFAAVRPPHFSTTIVLLVYVTDMGDAVCSELVARQQPGVGTRNQSVALLKCGWLSRCMQPLL